MKTEDYSAEVKDILIHKPIWIVRWGMLIVLLLFTLLLLGSYFFKFPIIISAPAELIKTPTTQFTPKSISIKAYIPTSTIESVKVGQPVTITVSTLPYKEFGKLNGSITAVSKLNDTQGYEVKIELSAHDASKIYTSANIDYSTPIASTANILVGSMRLIEQVISNKL